MSPPDDRAVILRRRALLLGSALAAFSGCQKTSPPPETAGGPVVAIPESQPDDAGAAEPALPTRDAGSRPRSHGNMPSLEIPTGIGDRARSNYESLVARMKRVHDVLDEIERIAPKCNIGACEDQWAPVAKKLFELEDAFQFSYTCPGSSADAKAFEERRREHMEFYEARRKAVEAWLTGLAGDWAKLQAEVDKERLANPRPCLSYACMDW